MGSGLLCDGSMTECRIGSRLFSLSMVICFATSVWSTRKIRILPTAPISRLHNYCMYIHRSGEPFGVDEASLDERVALHPKRQSVQCYCGIPLFGSKGKILGTVCHFDSMPVRVTEDVATVLDDLAPLIVAAAFSAGPHG